MGRGQNFEDGMMQKQRQNTTEIRTHQNQQIRRTQETQGPGQPSVYQEQNIRTAAGPDMPVAEAPAKKFHQQLGNLSKKERTETHSDVQRMAFKQNLLENVAMDEKGGYSQPFQDMLQAVKKYARINVTGDAKGKDENLLKAEQAYLTRAIEAIRALRQSLKVQKSQAAEWTQAQEKERKVLKIYEKYFSLDAFGYLELPQEAADTSIDCTHKNLTGTYKVWEWKKKDGKQVLEKVEKPIVMKEVPKETPLFPHEPSINDVAQGGLGDCYLLAALSAIIHQDPQLIKECMKDHGDGTVTVRLFRDIVRDGEKEGNLIPYYVKVKKAVPEGQPYASGSLWVQMLEHAYAASGFHKQTQGTSYGEIESGNPGKFVQTITGKRVNNITISHKEVSPKEFITKLSDQLGRRYVQANPERKIMNVAEISSLIFPITLTDVQKANKNLLLMNIYVRYVDYFTDKKEIFRTLEDVQEYLDSIYRTLPDMEELTPEQNQEMKQGFLQHLKELYLEDAATVLNHRAFSGDYTPYAMEVYEQIQKAQEQGKIMTASALETFHSQKDREGLNGEGMEMGLAANHAYTLLGVKQKGSNRYVELRNPWARGIRAYDRSTISGTITRERQDEGTHGIFLLEFNEFLDHFENMNFQ